jgi:NAD(P)-dependent dehydrogenase (short-subunit alcohol dehydrogenase family)
MQIQNHVFLVTGGGSGLGAATATMLAANGGKVVIADVNETGGKDTAGFLGGAVRFVRADVTDERSTQAAVDLCVSAFGGIHGLVN